MEIIKECLKTQAGLVVVTDMVEVDFGTPFRFSLDDGCLYYTNGELGVPINRGLLDYLFSLDTCTVIIYGGSDPLSREYLGHVALDRDQLLIAKGILWVLEGGEDVDPTPKKLPVQEGDSQYAGLRLPPEMANSGQ